MNQQGEEDEKERKGDDNEDDEQEEEGMFSGNSYGNAVNEELRKKDEVKTTRIM